MNMKTAFALSLLCISLPVAPAGADFLPDALVSNTAELRAAMAEVGPGERRVIRFASSHYEIAAGSTDTCRFGKSALPPVEGRITLAGNGAVISGRSTTFLPFCVERDGALTLQDLTITGFGTSPPDQPDRVDTIVAANAGHLRLVNVTIRGNGSATHAGPTHRPVIRRVLYNSSIMEMVRSVVFDNSGVSDNLDEGGIIHSAGELLIRDSSLIGNQVRRYFDDPRVEIERPVAFSFGGSAELVNATFSRNSHGIAARRRVLFVHNTIVNNGFGIKNGSPYTTVQNSIIAGNGEADCILRSPILRQRSPIRSRGANLDSDGSCKFKPARNFSGVDPQLQPLRRLDNELPGHEPANNSPALDAGDPDFCPLKDALGRIRNTKADKDPRCAIGAIEPPNEPPNFEIDARLTGTYYDPDHDGHYVSFQVLPIDLVAAVWWTYDPQGNPLWLIGSGEVDGDTAHIEVFASRGMVLPALDDAQRVQERWGTLELEFENCHGLEVRWNTDQPDFNNGQATLKRLTFNENLGC